MSSAHASSRTPITQVSGKDTLTVLVTDSGLGGLSVCAEIERRARTEHPFRSIRLVFANALPDAGRGYNTMPDLEEKARVFDLALDGMVRYCHPDVLLIACNTLSVVYPVTRFAGRPPVPTVGIVEFGVGMLYRELQRDPAAVAVVFGTETTISGGNHKRLLVQRGIAPGRIIEQACPNLAAAIEKDPEGEAVAGMVRRYVDEARNRLPPGYGRIFAGMFCTHYGYCASSFAAAFRGEADIIDPNTTMADTIQPVGSPSLFGDTLVSVEVLSRAEVFPEEVVAIAGLLEKTSPLTATALREYRRLTDLFQPW